jgi:hypothetical protein
VLKDLDQFENNDKNGTYFCQLRVLGYQDAVATDLILLQRYSLSAVLPQMGVDNQARPTRPPRGAFFWDVLVGKGGGGIEPEERDKFIPL